MSGKDRRLLREVGDLEGSGGRPIELYYFYITTDRPYMTGQEALRIIDSLSERLRQRLLDRHQRGSLKIVDSAMQTLRERNYRAGFDSVTRDYGVCHPTVDWADRARNYDELFNTHALIEAHSQDYLRDAQIQLILQPLIDRLLRLDD